MKMQIISVVCFLLAGCYTSSFNDNVVSTNSAAELPMLQSGIQRYGYAEKYEVPVQPVVPADWEYKKIQGTPFKMPLPSTAVILPNVGTNFSIVEVKSKESISLDNKDDFMFYFSFASDPNNIPKRFQSAENYFLSICNDQYPEGKADYTIYFQVRLNDILITKFYPNCIEEELEPDGEITQIRMMLLEYNSMLYQITLDNPKFTKLEGEKLLETAILNIRPSDSI